MRSIKKFGTAVVAVLSLAAMVGASSASALTWSPLNTNSGPASGVLTLTTNRGASVRCTYGSNAIARGTAPQTLAQTSNSAGTVAPPTWSSCSNSISPLVSTTVRSSSAWNLIATSTTTVDVTNGNAVISIGGVCTITATAVTVRGNGWVNGPPARLTANSAASFPISESGFLCDGGTTATMSGSVSISSGTIPSILP